MGRAVGRLAAGRAAGVVGDRRPKGEERESTSVRCTPAPAPPGMNDPPCARVAVAGPPCAWLPTAPLMPFPRLLWPERLFLPATSAATRLPRLLLPLLLSLLRRRRRRRWWLRCLLLLLPLLLLLLSPS